MLQSNKVKIGCDIGSYSIKWLEGYRKNNSFKILSYFEMPLPFHSIVDGHIRDFAAVARGFKNIFKNTSYRSNVSIAIQGSSTTLKKITVPFFKKEELPWCLTWEAQQYLPWDTDDVVLDYASLNETQIICAASLKKTVKTYTQFLEDLNLNLDRIEIAPLSLEKVWKLNYPDDVQKTVAIFSFGAQQSGLTLFQNQNFYGFYPLFIRGEELTQTIQKKIKLNFSEAEHLKLGSLKEAPGEMRESIEHFLSTLAYESKNALKYFISQDPTLSVDKIYLTGGVSQMDQLAHTLGEFLGAHVEIFDPLRKIECGKKCNREDLKKRASQMATALGLAMQEQ